MQIEILKRDDIELKLKTRELYENCFDEGKKLFIDYYYNTIIKRNEIVVAIEDDKILSMIHLNPYTYNVCGNVENLHYLVAIATDENSRHKGLMTMCMEKAIEYLSSLNEAFCYLVPEDNALQSMYKKFGFEVVADFNIDKFSDGVYDIFPEKNDEYVKLMEKEQEFLLMEDDSYIEELKQKKVMVKVLSNQKYSIEFLKTKRIYVCQEV